MKTLILIFKFSNKILLLNLFLETIILKISNHKRVIMFVWKTEHIANMSSSSRKKVKRREAHMAYNAMPYSGLWKQGPDYMPQSRNSSMNPLWNSVRRETTAGILSSWGSILHLKCHVPGTCHRITIQINQNSQSCWQQLLY